MSDMDNTIPNEEVASAEETKSCLILAKITSILGCIVAIGPFFITGFSFGILWYVIIVLAGFISIATLGTEGKSKDDFSFVKTAIVIVCVIGIIMYLWGPLNPDYSVDRNGYDTSDYFQYGDSNNSEDSAPSWIQGTWYCVTPYGNMQVEIQGNTIREIPGDGSSYYGTYHIQDDKIMPNTGSQMYYQMDFSRKRLSAGQGYYFTKQ